jgi:DNA-binding beta-propeller fold protein YncE
VNKTFYYLQAFLLVFFIASCHYPRLNKTVETSEQALQHSSYDDSTLNNNLLPVLMPYNRIIDPAGTVITWGNPNLENHSLDVKIIPGTDFLAVEERNGIAIIDSKKKTVISKWNFSDDSKFRNLKSTFSGIQVWQSDVKTFIFWSAASNSESYVMQAQWDGTNISIKDTFSFKAEGKSPLALPNEVAVNEENNHNYLYVTLNGNNQIVKIDLQNHQTIWTKPTGLAPYGITIVGNKIYVTNWAGKQPSDSSEQETAGVPYGEAFINPKTGAINNGTVSIFDLNGSLIKETEVGLHPNDIAHSSDNRFVFVSNANSDDITVMDTRKDIVVETIPVKLFPGVNGFIGDSPGALALGNGDSTLFVANGLDNAIAVISLGNKSSSGKKAESFIEGFIPTEAYPSGIEIANNALFITNLEGEGSRVNSQEIKKENPNANVPETNGGAYNSHKQKATLSIIPIPDFKNLIANTEKVQKLNLTFRAQLARVLPRPNIASKPVPERIGEPSVFKHVIYIIKENRTYDQILGDMKEGAGREDLCIFGNKITPNEHQLAKDFLLLDNYYVSGKSSAEGHQWTDAAMVTDYVERNVGAWFRSYPHVQTDALVYDKNGFIWNNATSHGKSVRIYGEACTPRFQSGMTWTKIYDDYKNGKPFQFTNTSTISAVRPLMSPSYPCYDSHRISDQIRASAFIKELNEYEKMPGDSLPQLMILALPADHTGGTAPGLPTPRAMVADNDLALGRIIEALTKSRFWKNTVVFVTEDDSQSGWDHVSAYRTTGFVISAYSRLQQTVHINYNQTCIVRTIEQILGIPPMNAIDATALPMFKCFSDHPSNFVYNAVPNQVPLNEMNPSLTLLKGKSLYYAKQSLRPEFEHIDGGNDDLLNKIIWFDAKGKQSYPQKFAGKDDDGD